MKNSLSFESTEKKPEISIEPTADEVVRLRTLYQKRHYVEAEKNAKNIIQRFPNHGAVWKVLGAVLQAQGKIKESLHAKETAARLLPNDAEAYNILGNAYQGLNRLKEAENCLRRALKILPDSFVILNNLGLTLEKQARFEEAKSCYEKALTLSPDYVTGYYNYGNVLQKMAQFEEAERSYRRALALQPNYAEVYNNLGILLLEKLARFEDAEFCCRQAVTLQPNFAEAHYNYGNALQQLERLEEAEKSYQHALALRPNHVDTYTNYGNVLQKLQRFDEAEKNYRLCLVFQPDYAESYNNLGLMFAKLERFEEAEACYRQAFVLRPDFAAAHSNFSMLLMLLGRLQEGWREYQWVYHPKNDNPNAAKPPNLSLKRWQGESLQGKTILILSEQGFGDMIQFVRYAEHLQRAGATVWIAVKPPLVELFKTIPWLDRVLAVDDLLPAGCDFWTFPLALPFWFQTALETVPCNIPYLSVDTEKSAWWRVWLDKQIPAHHKRIGLVWAGRPTQGNDKNRSLALSQFAGFANLENITFVSLQLGEKAQQEIKDAPVGLAILDASPFIADFSDSAALLNNLDVLITVCSAPAHLAGALNLPVWTIISKPYDWRWLLNRSDTVWYKSMRLFRQPVRGDWKSVLQEVKAALIAL